jgi:hypothetical protein
MRRLTATATLLLTLGALTASPVSPATAVPLPWVPTPGQTWQYQLQGSINTSVNADVFDIDGEDTPAYVVSNLHAQGKVAICYFSAGSWENWRSDAAAFPATVKGRTNGWPGEKWLDIRQRSVLRPIMDARLSRCAAKGFDGAEPDNVDGYTNRTGFALTGAHQAAYNRMIANLAHSHGLKVGLKNDVDQAALLEPSFDFAVNEQCTQYSECGTLGAFTRAGKPVFHVEYRSADCRPVAGHSVILKTLDLTATPRTVC